MATLNLRTPNSYDGQPGTQSKMGAVRFATAAEVAAQTALNVAVSPGLVASGVPDASETVKGKAEIATGAECVTGTDNTRIVSPAGLTSRLAAPGAIGGTTPAAGTFTAVTASTGAITATLGNIVSSAGSVSAATTVTAGTNLVATAGSVSAATTVTAGTDLVSTAGNVLIQGAGKQIRIEGGAVTDFIGQATLTAGTVTVLNTNIAAADKIMVTRQGINGSTALGVFDVAITPATSFSITARNPADATTQTNDVSIVDYVIFRQL